MPDMILRLDNRSNGAGSKQGHSVYEIKQLSRQHFVGNLRHSGPCPIALSLPESNRRPTHPISHLTPP